MPIQHHYHYEYCFVTVRNNLVESHQDILTMEQGYKADEIQQS